MPTGRPSVQEEIAALEESLRRAELGPDPGFFQATLADNAVLTQNGELALTKQHVVDGHQPHGAPKFINVETRGLRIVDCGDTAVVTCESVFTTPDRTARSLKVLRVWHRRADTWQIIAASIFLAEPAR